MAETPFTPPPRKPVSDSYTPVHTDSYYIEVVNRDDPGYKAQAPVKRGTLYSSMIGAKPEVIAAYPSLFFLEENRLGTSDQLVTWKWATDPLAEDTYNAGVSYALEAIYAPTFARVYTIRREVYDTLLPLELGLPLTGLIGVEITDGGNNYTYASGTIDDDATVDFVCAGGVIISAIVTNEGSGVLSGGAITITGDGGGATATAIIQPSSAVLVSQKKSEFPDDNQLRNEYVQVARIYQTLPGPTIYSTRTDEDGATVTIATTAKIAATIIPREFINVSTWYKVNRQQQDNVYVGNEVIESRTVKTATSDPADNHTMYSSRIDDDGKVVQIGITLADIQAITEGETLTGVSPNQLWTKTNSKAVSDLVSQEIVEIRVIPGNVMPTSRVDEDGIPVTINTTLKDQTLVTTGETLLAGVWTKTRKEPAALTSTVNITDLVVKEVVESRAIPGNPMTTTRVDKDGVEVDVVRTMKDTSIIVTSETLSLGIWVKRYKEAISDLVAWEVVEGRAIPGTPVPSASVGTDLETETIASTLKDTTVITPGATESGGTLTVVTKNEVSDIISEEKVSSKTWLDEAFYSRAIPNLIPESFRSQIPTKVESHIVVGIASDPAFSVPGELEKSEKQLNKTFFERRITSIDAPVLPVIINNLGLTREFGGDTTQVILTLNLHGTLTIDQGLQVLDSKITDLGNGYDIKTTEQGLTGNWPQLDGQDYDERLDVLIPYTQQVVTPGTGISLPKTDVKPIDQWREEDRTIDATAAASVLDAYLMAYPSKINVDMPNRLISAEGVIESAAGEGTGTENGAISVAATFYSLSQSVTASAQSSVTLSPVVTLLIQQFWGNNIDCTHYHFFLPNPVTSADVLTKINALLASPVSDWPKFNPETANIHAFGESRNLQVKASSGGSIAVSGGTGGGTVNTSVGGTEYSISVGSNFRNFEVSPTIHPEINLTGTTSDSRGISASAFSEMAGLGPPESITQSDTAIATISPTTLTATEGATDWPSTGLYLYRVDAQPYRYGYVQFHVVIVDAADFPINP